MMQTRDCILWRVNESERKVKNIVLTSFHSRFCTFNFFTLKIFDFSFNFVCFSENFISLLQSLLQTMSCCTRFTNTLSTYSTPSKPTYYTHIHMRARNQPAAHTLLCELATHAVRVYCNRTHVIVPGEMLSHRPAHVVVVVILVVRGVRKFDMLITQ